MAKMRPLDPAPKVPLPKDGWELLATEAGRYGTGLRATVQVWNGELQATSQLALAYPHTWVDFLSPLCQQMQVTVDVLSKVVLRLASGIEGVLRQAEEAEARPRAKQQANEDETAQGEPIRFVDDDDEPSPDPVDGAQLLDALVTTFLRYVFLPPGSPEALALWTLHTHPRDRDHLADSGLAKPADALRQNDHAPNCLGHGVTKPPVQQHHSGGAVSYRVRVCADAGAG
jgi:hypothetical protein